MSHLMQPALRRPFPRDGNVEIPRLEPGDHLDQPTLHARDTAMPDDVKAELIGRRLLEVLRDGLATAEHAAFVTRLAAR